MSSFWGPLQSTESPKPTKNDHIAGTPTRNVVWRQTPTVDQEEIGLPTPTFDPILTSTVYFGSYKGPYSAIELRGMRLIKATGLNDDIYPDSPGQFPGVGHTLNLAFANDSSFVAYIRDLLSPENTPRELWITDVSLNTIEKVWVDENGWLGDIGDASVTHDSDLIWGPFDRYVLMWSYLTEKNGHMVVYDVEKREAYEWVGDCNRLAKSPFSNRLSVWCVVQNGDSSYAVLESNGVFFTNTAPENIVADTLTWRFSSDGDQVLFLGEDLRWRFTDKNQNIFDIPVQYIENFRYRSPKAINFQWSQDGRRVLVFGKSDDLSLCPYSSFEPASKTEERGCWFVVDTQTREIIWHITERIIETVKLSVENSSIDYNASLSPDGQFLILTITDYRLGYVDYLVITSLATGESAEIKINHGWLPGYKLSWFRKSP